MGRIATITLDRAAQLKRVIVVVCLAHSACHKGERNASAGPRAQQESGAMRWQRTEELRAMRPATADGRQGTQGLSILRSHASGPSIPGEHRDMRTPPPDRRRM
jgi:hypothetical protein